MKKIKSTVAPVDRVSADDLPGEAINALFAMVEDCKVLNRSLPILKASIKQLEQVGDAQSKDVAQVGRVALEYVEMLLLGFMHQLDGYDDREFFNEAQKPLLTAPKLYVSLEETARHRLEFYRQVDKLRSAWVKAAEQAEAEKGQGGAT